MTYGYGELGGIYAKQIVQTGETAIRPTDPKVNGFTFLGWYTESGELLTDLTATENRTVYAQWESDFY